MNKFQADILKVVIGSIIDSVNIEPKVEDKTKDPRVPIWHREFIKKLLEEINEEDETGFIITEFEIKKVNGER